MREKAEGDEEDERDSRMIKTDGVIFDVDVNSGRVTAINRITF